MFMTNTRSMNRNKIILYAKKVWGWERIVKFVKLPNNEFVTHHMCMKKNNCYRFVINPRL